MELLSPGTKVLATIYYYCILGECLWFLYVCVCVFIVLLYFVLFAFSGFCFFTFVAYFTRATLC